MNISQLYENPLLAWIETPIFSKEKVQNVREILEKRVLDPKYHLWKKDNEVHLITDLALGKLPEDMADIKNNAQILIMGYMLYKCQGKAGIETWQKEYDDYKKDAL